MLLLSAWPMDWIETPTAIEFLVHFALLALIAFFISMIVRWIGRMPWRSFDVAESHELNVYEAAYLSGGWERLADAVMAGMFKAGRLELVKPRRLKVKGDAPTEMGSPEHTVYVIGAAGGTVKDARRAVKHSASGIEDGLIEREFVSGALTRFFWRMVSAIPFVLLVVACAMRVKIGYDRGESFLLVIVAGLLSLGFAFKFAFSGLRATARGRRALRMTRKRLRKKQLIRNDASPDWAWACGLYGPGALPSDEAGPLQSALKPGNGGNASDGGSGCSGCSGCGGGCGGCGGCGG